MWGTCNETDTCADRNDLTKGMKDYDGQQRSRERREARRDTFSKSGRMSIMIN